MDEYADILSEIRAEKGIQKVPPVQETPSKIETETDWYDSMISQSKKAGELVSEPSAPIEKKSQISPLLSPILAAPEITGQLAWGVASWLPSKITGAATGALMKLSNALLESEQKSKGRTSEERAVLQKIAPHSPEEIRKMQDKTEAWWQVMPPPATKEAKDVLEKVGKGLDWLLGPFKTADEYYTERGFPVLGYNLRAIGELLYFKGLHGLGTKITPKVKALRKKLIRKAPPEELAKHLERTLDEIKTAEVAPKGDELKRVTKSQKIKAHKIQREQGLSKAEYMEIAKRVSGETSIKDMNKDIAGKFIKELKKGKEGLEKARGIEKGEEIKVEEKKEEVVEEAEVKEVKEEKIEEVKDEEVKIEEVKEEIKLDTGESLAKEFDLRYMGKMEDLELYSMKVLDGETTIATKGVSREALVRRMEEVREQFKIKEIEGVRPPAEPEPEVQILDKKRIQNAEKHYPPTKSEYLEKKGVHAHSGSDISLSELLEIQRNQGDHAAYLATIDSYDYITGGGARFSDFIKDAKKNTEFLNEIYNQAIPLDELFFDVSKRIQIEEIYTDIQTAGEAGLWNLKPELKIIKIEPTKAKKVKPEAKPSSESVKTLISDDIRTAEDMGIYAEIKEMLGEKKKIGEIMKEVKQKAYYKEDLADFGYVEKDIREAIRAIKAEKGDEGAIKQIQDVLKKEKKKVEEITETEEIEPSVAVERVDPETGRLAGVKEDLITAPKEMDETRMRYELEQMPITREDGSIAKSKFVAMKRVEELGRVGDLVKNPKGEGWLVKKTKEQRETKAKEESKEWEEILKEEELGDLGDEGLGERVDLDVDTVFDPLKGERGAITFHRKTVKELKRIVKKGYYTRNRIIRELRKRGASDEDILKVFPDASVRILNKGKESKWWKVGQDPLALLPRRTLPNKLKAPAITRGEAHMIATMKDMPARLTAEHLSWENAIRTFEKLPKEMKKTFYRSVKEGESLAFDRLQDVLKRSKKIRQSVDYFSHKRIGTHAITQQPDGIAVLAQQGITKIPKLKPKELKAYKDLRTIYNEFFVSVNRARKVAGEKPFPPVDNYFTWIQDITYLSKTEGVGLFSNWRTIESKMAEIKKVPSFRFAKFRAGPEKPRKLNLNPFTVIDTYAKTATHYVEMAPRLAKLNELLTEKYGMAQTAPHAYNFIRHWLNYQAGKIPAWDLAHPTTRGAMRTLNSNIVYSLLAYNVRSALIQPAALASSYTMLGNYYTAVGLSHIMSPAKWKMAGKMSKIINTRTPETAIYEAMEMTGKFPSMLKKRVAGVGMLPLTVLDSVSARITLLGAYTKGRQKLKLSEEAAWNYADDIVTRTQASAAKSDVAPIQRTQLGKTVTCLQTFVINHWGFLTKDVLGIKNADIKNSVVVKRVIRFILATTAMNVLYEDGLGLNSPNPTPIRAYREMFEETADHKKAFARGVKEIAEYIPLWGGRLRYGSEIGGPVLSELLKLIENGDVDALIKLMGIPGSNQFFKMVRAYERSGTDVDIALGRYVDPDKDKIKSLTTPFK